MKRSRYCIFVFILMLIAQQLFAQIQKPVEWNFSAKKLSATSYEIHLTANIKSGWHIYSQFTPDGGPVATNITYNKNPLVTIKGKAKETGKLEKQNEPLFGVDVMQFENTVDFVQTATLKAGVKTNVSGTVEFMVCNNKQCLPPSKQTFNIQLQ